MKEFSAQTGGRYTYADDLENLQELALAFGEIFDDCDNFIVSGCEVSGNSIGAGVVYLNGKLRKFSGATNLTSWPQYIYESNSTESVPYESGGSKVGRNIYGCAIANIVPTTADPLTQKAPAFMSITQTGGKLMKDAFIGKYALLLNPAIGSQSVNSIVNFIMPFNCEDDLTVSKDIVVKRGSLATILSYDGSTFSITAKGNNGRAYKLAFIDGLGFTFSVNGTQIAKISAEGVSFDQPVSAGKGTFGGLVLTENDFYQGSANGSVEVGINMKSYNGGIDFFRDTTIGNGKGQRIITVIGSTGAVGINGATTIAPGSIDALTLKANVVKANSALTSAIAWKDSANILLARIGFTSTENQKFYLTCDDYNIEIKGGSIVNIGPAIAENGTLLSEKYVLASALTTALSKKADSDKVYSTTQANERFAIKNNGLSQFVSDTVTATQCRGHIGAAGIADLAACAKLDKFLSDMATDNASKKKVRDNIGAAGKDEYEPKLQDSGWKLIKDSLYIRQIGNIVCIQGSTKTVHDGTVFNIPNTIAPPSHAVKHTIAFKNNRSWVCKIAANQRACTVVYCDSSCGNTTEFSITYMV